MKLRIVQLVNYYQPVLGYQEYHLAVAFASFGHESQVITSNYFFPYPDYEKNFRQILGNRKNPPGKKHEMKITTWRLPTTELVPGSQVLLHKLARALEQIKPDVIICHNPYLLLSYQIAKLKHKYSFKLIYDTHAAAFNTNLTDTLAKRLYMLWFNKLAVPQIKSVTDGFFAIGESERELLVKTFNLQESSVSIIRLGVDTNLFKFSLRHREEIRQKLKIKPNDTLLIYAGKITPNKGVIALVESLKQLDPQYKLLLLGGGSGTYFKEISNVGLDKERLIMLETVINKELPKYFSAADIGVWPGDPSLSMLEALVTGLPLIVVKSEETEYLAELESVFRFPRVDVDSLAKTIKKLPKIDEIVRIERQNELKNQFSWENKANEVLNLLKT